ncbi:unnamed protein product [Ambrosiozyma monospora]|uniref:Unnamed protein product n=1 Tax=Ambrosiozyma monospora TaxID=43982 RepID=A0A9W6YY54_AMBMO|nr:unnamed protein product [Ambrosiozyma monospora]
MPTQTVMNVASVDSQYQQMPQKAGSFMYHNSMMMGRPQYATAPYCATSYYGIPPPIEPQKRKRKKSHEVERLYHCNFKDCKKAYGTLNHLNSHVVLQNHGPKRLPSEFKELREMLKKKRREEKARLRQQQQQQQKKANSLGNVENSPYKPQDLQQQQQQQQQQQSATIQIKPDASSPSDAVVALTYPNGNAYQTTTAGYYPSPSPPAQQQFMQPMYRQDYAIRQPSPTNANAAVNMNMNLNMNTINPATVPATVPVNNYYRDAPTLARYQMASPIRPMGVNVADNGVNFNGSFYVATDSKLRGQHA